LSMILCDALLVLASIRPKHNFLNSIRIVLIRLRILVAGFLYQNFSHLGVFVIKWGAKSGATLIEGSENH
jgi:hypothetical protein